MQFNSIEFLFWFLPGFLVLYYCVRPELSNLVLVLGSLVFYTLAGNSYWWTGVLLILTVLVFLWGRTLTGENRKGKLTVYLIVLGLILVCFKLIAGGRYLPAGMSFYLFQMAAYLIDVFRGRITPENKILVFAAQMVMFPKLLSGPLMSARDLKILSRTRKAIPSNFREGLQLLILGLALKVIFANRLGGIWSVVQSMNYTGITAPLAWMGLISYTLKLYLDFYGYSLMAMGIGLLLGYRLPKNFDNPYAAKTVSEFYRRWHMSLGAWFREYLYIPLGGNRGGTLRTVINLAVVWLFTGLWHGTGGNYILWAGFLFLLIVNERLWLGRILNRSRVLCHVYLVFVILLSWVPFFIGGVPNMMRFLSALFGMGGPVVNPADYRIWGQSYLGLMLGGILLSTPLPGRLWRKIRSSTLADVALVVLFWVVVYYISTAAQDPFMYFQY